ncbi:MAG: outer membrane beta-barrel protein, partial [Verrucomicrobiota bacterium]|nr:outer membrane beta-barrel protein [Verrucomicrobiota bacterium]
LLCFSAEKTRGQATGAAQDRSQLFRTEPGLRFSGEPGSGGEDLGYASSSANDADLGVQALLKRETEYQPFSITVSAPYYYTSNVALSRNGEMGDGVFSPSIAFAYQPKLAKTLYVELIVAQQLFYYNDNDVFNFGSFDAIAGLVYYLPQYHNLTLRGRYDFNRLTTDSFDEFFANHALDFSAEMPFQFGRALQLTMGVSADVSLAATPSAPQRSEFDAYAGLQAQLSRSFSLDAVTRIAVKDYYQGGRTDMSEFLSLSASYRIREWLTVTALTSFVWNQSNQSVFDYSVYNLGGAIALTVKF